MLDSRFMSHVSKSRNGCWHWTAHVTKRGYGQCYVGSRTDGTRRSVLAHRWAYERHHGVQLPGPKESDYRQVDHECHNRSKSCRGGPTCMHRRCVNPAHLVLATPKENTEASEHTPAHRNRRKTHCPQGHEYTPQNTYTQVRANGTTVSRSCRRCQIAKSTARRRRQRAAVA